MNSLITDGESNSSDHAGDKTFISKLLGEMKSQFNKQSDTETDIKTEDDSMNETHSESSSTKSSQLDMETPENFLKMELDTSTTDVSSTNNPLEELDKPNKNSDDEEKPRIVLLFKKPQNENSKSNSSSTKEASPGRRSLRHKSTSNSGSSTTSNLKRSSRRRSKDCNESVLQSAIARKEKSYNESSKPQRLTRQLKPTKKILENLAMAKQAVKSEKSKNSPEKSNNNKYDSSDNSSNHYDEETDVVVKSKKHHRNSKHSRRISKRFRGFMDSDKESDSDRSNSLDESQFEKNSRRSSRISSGRFKVDENSMDMDESLDLVAAVAEQSDLPEDPECSSVGAELIASKLCLCTKQTQLYATSVKGEPVHCNAIDNVSDKFVGCSRIVNIHQESMLRPSSRVPYVLLCDLHRNRMLRHNCCPTCGVFCTQGRFVECEAGHQYHRECQISVGEMECCPHCGASTPAEDVIIKMHTSRKPVILPVPKNQYPSAKMSFQSSIVQIDRDSPPTPPLVEPGSIPTINFDVDMDDEETYSENELLVAAKCEDLERLALILGSKTVDVNFKIADFNDGTILHYSAHNGFIGVVHLLMVAGMELDVLDKEQSTPLMLAVTAHKNEVVQYLSKVGASITLKGTDGMTALHLAAKCGNLIACQILLEAGANIHNFVNCQDDGGWTPLVWACEHGYVEVANFLIKSGADPALRDVEHNVALHWAAFSGSSRIVELLLNKGCEVNAVNAHGDTPLHIGAREDKYNCIIILLARGADVALINKNNESALDCVPEDGNSYNLIALNVHMQNVIASDYGRRKTILSNDISKGKEVNPIQCVNIVDDEPLPSSYVYISKNCITSDEVCIDVKLSSMNNCNCEERCTSEDCSCGKLSMKCWYDDDGKLTQDFSFSDSPLIFECNDSCACNSITCNNRVVQKGLTQRFQLCKTELKGWGVITLRFIPKGSFVCEYVGEILTDMEADQREDDSYLFDLDNRICRSENMGESYCIDAKYYGNLARFINHSCRPNLHPVRVFIDHQDLKFPRIAFFANRDIGGDEELSFDYGEKFWLVKYKSFSCHCEAFDCKYSKEAIKNTIDNYNKRFIEEEDLPSILVD